MSNYIDIPRNNHFPTETQLLPFNAAANTAISTPKPVQPVPVKAIKQTERLYTTRSRNVLHQDGAGDRGQKTYIKLLTTDKKRSAERFGGGHDAKPSPGFDKVLGSALNEGSTGYASFLLTDVNCNLEEKLQILEVFGDAEVTYYFGRQPIIFNFSGILIDSVDNSWFTEWLEMYTHVMRGTQLARNYELLEIVLPNMKVTGTIVSTSWSQNSQRDVDIPFQFRFLAKYITPIPVSVPNKPLADKNAIDFDQAAGFQTQLGINGIKNASLASQASELRSVVANPLSTVKDYSSAMTNFGSGMSTLGLDAGTFKLGEFGSGVSYNTGSDSTSNTGLGIPQLPTNGNSTGSGNSGASSGLSTLSASVSGITSSLSGIRASLFSPIYGVMSSLTKLIKETSGSIKSVVSSFTSPLRDILRDVKNISNQAIGVVNAVNNTIHSVTTSVLGVQRDILDSVSLLKKTAGVVTSIPQSVSGSVGQLVKAGKMSTKAGFLSSIDYKPLPNGTKGPRVVSKLPLLGSGVGYTAELGGKI